MATNLTKIAPSMQEDVISSYWIMMNELMSQADNDNDPVLKVMVEGFFRQWNKMTGSNNHPRWVDRENTKKILETFTK